MGRARPGSRIRAVTSTPTSDPPTSDDPSSPAPARDNASDVLRAARQPLDAIFRPRSVAVIGATEKAGSVGRTCSGT